MIRVAVIGAGIGRAHLDAYDALPDTYRVTVVCDLDTARARSAVGDRPGVAVGTDYGEVLAGRYGPVDLVDVCLPPALHVDACLAALDSGRHVICEKPLATSLADVDRLAASVERTGLVLAPVFQYRYGLGTAQLRALRDAGLTGRLLVATAETHWNRPPAYYDVAWRGTWGGEGGGAILGHAIHIHDLLMMVTGPVASLSAELVTLVNDIEVEDCAAITFRLASGAVATSSVTLGAATESSRLRFVNEHVTVDSDTSPYAPARRGWTFTSRRPADQAAVDEVVAGVAEPPAGYVGMFAAVAATIAGEPSDVVTLDDGRRSIELVTAIYAAARSGRRQTLPLGPDHPLHHGWLPV